MLFFREKPAMMLVTLLNKNSNNNSIYASNLAKVVDCTYSHVVKILQEMEKAGLVEFKKQGRLKVLSLAKKGIEKAAGYIDKMNHLSLRLIYKNLILNQRKSCIIERLAGNSKHFYTKKRENITWQTRNYWLCTVYISKGLLFQEQVKKALLSQGWQEPDVK